MRRLLTPQVLVFFEYFFQGNAEDVLEGPLLFYSWNAAYRIWSNGSRIHEEEQPWQALGAGRDSGQEILRHFDIFSHPNVAEKGITAKSLKVRKRRRREAERSSVYRETVDEAKAEHDAERLREKEEEESEEEFDLSPELKVKIYTGVILATLALIVFVMFIWPLFKCLRGCCRIGTTICMAGWDLLHCRDPGYRFMRLAAIQAGLDPPSPEEYDRFMSGWEEKAPEMMEALMD